MLRDKVEIKLGIELGMVENKPIHFALMIYSLHHFDF
jgi:hypothetical protein